MDSAISPVRVEEIYRLIAPHVRRTPIVQTRGFDFGLPASALVLKLELLQHAGSFKTRGAFANLLSRTIPPAGVCAASGGNHGAAVAYAAAQLGIPATIFVPAVSTQAKVDRIRGYGANLVIAGQHYSEAFEASQHFIAESGALAIHAFNDVETLLGQATVALEFEQQSPALDTLFVAVGGGGLIGGIAAWYAGRIRLIGVEPESAPTLTRALAAGRPVDAPTGGIAVDSLAPRRVGERMFPLAQEYVSEMILVSDADIHNAQLRLWDALRVAAEPGGAASLAPVLSGRYLPTSSERIGILICGGNTVAVNFGPGPCAA